MHEKRFAKAMEAFAAPPLTPLLDRSACRHRILRQNLVLDLVNETVDFGLLDNLRLAGAQLRMLTAASYADFRL